ncbi:MAG TPA: energy-coupling factor ABC transporter permease [Spirochaetota bacterium]|jgi:cobalt/nickel transport system permease protein|nr:energy-coupling factor ABC transporter permease [Spirochaetota bacterium]HOK91855.1 energy-coupling factor ABC transporter permease [Spirochaetota bacterium]HOQ11807.1 energy-coupling factor ABC transporter permease [Spirochaetota bacterium]HPX92438.1 energy-coupling factor ABC transporter permease [Spirochaetota bacterium]HRS62361.1 energy-coupling factor ABC transporter permease [Spirochaetota bacterium]
MHMADALISPSVGGTMIAASAGLIAYSSSKVKKELDDKKVPLMGVMGAFIFAAQMINFTIPATGSSGHIGGGLLLSIILGPYAAFLTIASVLIVQALFFADGGLLALGCNIFNLGFFPCFIVYPFIYKKIVGDNFSTGRIFGASLLSAILSLQLGAFCVVLETLASGITALPFSTFVLLMQPIHLAIGVGEGIATAAIVLFLKRTEPEVFYTPDKSVAGSYRKALIAMVGLAIVTGAILSWFASQYPDGLEWSMEKVAGTAELETPGNSIYEKFKSLQEKTAFLPDYDFKAPQEQAATEEEAKWPAVSAGTSISGLIGGTITLLLVILFGFLLKNKKVVE